MATCVGSVIPGGSYGAFHAHVCGRIAKVTGADGKPYCGIHDPAKAAAKEEAASRAKYDAEFAARQNAAAAVDLKMRKAAEYDAAIALLNQVRARHIAGCNCDVCEFVAKAVT